MRLEKAQHRSGEQANRQKRQNKAERVNCDEQETDPLPSGSDEREFGAPG